MIYDFFYNLKRGTEPLTYGRDIVAKWCVDYADKIKNSDINVLDVGVGTGVDLLNIKQMCGSKNINLFGLEVYEPCIEKAKQNKIKIFSIIVNALTFEDVCALHSLTLMLSFHFVSLKHA